MPFVKEGSGSPRVRVVRPEQSGTRGQCLLHAAEHAGFLATKGGQGHSANR